MTRRALVELIGRVRDQTGTTYRDMARRAADRGHEISFQQINNYAQGVNKNVPNPRMIRALAAAVDRPYEEVLAAVLAEFMDYEVADLSGDAGHITVPVPHGATEQDRQRLQDLAEAWVAL